MTQLRGLPTEALVVARGAPNDWVPEPGPAVITCGITCGITLRATQPAVSSSKRLPSRWRGRLISQVR
jgi:hypothetical protein